MLGLDLVGEFGEMVFKLTSYMIDLGSVTMTQSSSMNLLL